MKTINSLIRASLFLLLSMVCSNAQVGVNTTNPHPSAALDVQSSNQGLLIPRIPNAARIAMTNMANSLLVYDIDMKMYFYYQSADNKWYSLNAWTSEVTVSSGNTDTTTYTLSKVGIGTTTPTQALTVAGNTQVSGNMVVGGNTQVTGTVTGSKLYGEGAVPVGAIMMWSGNPSSLPVGWALCDSQGGRPDLRGRFVVGYTTSDIDYNTIGKVGGLKEVTLTAAQSGLPAHNHVTEKYELQTSNVQANGFTWPPLWSGTSPNVNTTQNCPPQNAQQPHENRPPYFVIAYIIKVTY